MNWEVIGTVAEIVGAAGVIITLLYVAKQIREASRDEQRSRYNELTTSIAQVAQTWSTSESLSDIMYRGLRDVSSLEPDEVFRFYSLVFGVMRAWEAAYHYSLERGVHAWGVDGLRTTMTSFMALPGLQHYWADRRDWYSRKFQDEVDRIITSGGRPMDDAYGEKAQYCPPQ